jgi:hypothetical protein
VKIFARAIDGGAPITIIHGVTDSVVTRVGRAVGFEDSLFPAAADFFV